MKFKVLILLLLSGPFLWGQVSQQQKTETWIKVWGFLKYNHPKVASGSLDWDAVFVSHLVKIEALDSEEQINKAYIELLNRLGVVKPCEKCNQVIMQDSDANLNITALWENTELSPILLKRFDLIRKNRNIGNNSYVKFYRQTQLPLFNTERSLSTELLPSKNERLLAMARFWNTVAYFYPYKDLLSKDWNSVLSEMIPVFKGATTAYGYQLGLVTMAKYLEDSNVFVGSELLSERIGAFRVPFSVTSLQGAWVVNRFDIDSLAQQDGIVIGDQILEVDGVSIDRLVKDKGMLIPASNQRSLEVAIGSTLLNGSSKVVDVTVLRNEEPIKLTVNRMEVGQFVADDEYDESLPWKKVETGVVYVDAKNLLVTDMAQLQNDLERTTDLIIDLRSYELRSGLALADYLVLKNTVFAQMIEPNSEALGTFIERKRTHIVENQRKVFLGNCYVLVNEKTRGQAELLTMLLKTNKRVQLIGAKTSGTVGYISRLQLPGKVDVFFTGVGLRNADRSLVHKVGIEPDVFKEPTLDDLARGKDVLLEEALRIIKEKSN